MEDAVCYCFGYSVSDIKRDAAKNGGKSTIIERIAREKKAGNCQCATKNPKRK